MAETYMYFFSNHCKFCMNLTSEINSRQFQNINIFPVCIDSAEMKKKIPRNVTKVPAIMNSKTKETFVGNKAFVFVKSISSSNRSAVSNPPPGKGSSHSGDPSPWLTNEMGCTFSDQYSFLNTDTSTKGNGGFGHSFVFLNGGLDTIPTPQQPNSNQGNPSEIDNLIAQRDRDIPRPHGRVG